MDNNYAPPNSDMTAGNGTGGVTNTMLDAMVNTRPWVLLIGILVIIGAASILITTVRIFAGAPNSGFFLRMTMIVAVIYLMFSIVFIFLGRYLIKYSSAIGRLRITKEASDLEAALLAQKRFWELAGIIILFLHIVMVFSMVL